MNSFIARVLDLNSKGEGVLKSEAGKTYFCPGAWLGELVEVEVLTEKKSFGKVQLKKILEASKSRGTKNELCSHHGFSERNCGGCPWLEIEYSEQCRYKESEVSKLAQRLTSWQEALIPEIEFFSSESNTDYRNRARLHYNGEQLGFHSYQSDRVVQINKCAVLNEECQKQLHSLLESQQRKTLIHRPEFYLDDRLSLEEIQEGHSPGFRQANSQQNNRCLKILNEYLSQIEVQTGLELFCGDGNFSAVLNEHTDQLHCVESHSMSLQKLADKKYSGLKTHKLNLYDRKSLARLRGLSIHSDLLFLDPPRSGYKDLNALVESTPKLKHLIYLSCNPATLLRDLQKVLEEKKLQVVSFVGLDFFPNTPHLEVMAFLQKRL